MRHMKSVFLLAGALSAFSGVASADYYTYNYKDVSYARTAPAPQDYLTFSFGTSFSDLESKGAGFSLGYHRQYSERPGGLGLGAKLTSSLSSTRSEGAAPGGEDLTMRYTALSSYVSTQFALAHLSDVSGIVLEARAGLSATKAAGTLPTGMDENIDFGVYYGGGVIYETPYDFQTYLDVNVHESLDVTEVHTGFRLAF